MQSAAANSEQPSIIEQLVRPRALGDFVVWLRAREHHIDPHQIADLQYLLINLRELGVGFRDSEDLGRWLAPVLCKSPATSTALRGDIAIWWRMRRGPDGAKAAPIRSAMSQDDGPREQPPKARWAWIVGSVAGLVLVALLLLMFDPPNAPVPEIPVEGIVTQEPSVLARFLTDIGDFRLVANSLFQPADRLGVYVMLLAGLVLLWKRAIEKKIVFQRAIGRGPSQQRDYHFRPRLAELIAAPDILSRLRELRIPQLIPGRGLDVARSLEATRKAGGFVQLIEEQIGLTPEYLLLVERRGPNDHLAYLGDQVEVRLREEHIFVDRYEFHLNPRRFLMRVSEAADVRRSLSLDELTASHERQRLILVTDARCFIDPLTGQPHPWLDAFDKLPIRAIVTPLPEEDWDHRERQLMQMGFLVLPADRWGLHSLIDLLADASEGTFTEQPVRPVRVGSARGRTLPYVIKEEGRRLLSPNATLDDRETRTLLRALRGYLRGPNMLWLQACAVFPKIDPRLTLHLGRTLSNEQGEPMFPKGVHEEFIALSRLPWFQAGFMPDWLRQALVRTMPAWLQPKVMETLNDLLKTGRLKKRAGDLVLQVADQPARDRRPEDYRKAREGVSDTTADTGLPQDYLFLGFMAGDPAKQLSVEAPPALQRQLRRQLLAQPIRWSVAGIALFLAMAAYWPPEGLLTAVLSTDISVAIVYLAAIYLGIGCWVLDRVVASGPKRFERIQRAGRLIYYGLFALSVLSSLRPGNAIGAALPLIILQFSVFLLVSRFSAVRRLADTQRRFARLFQDNAWLGEAFLWFLAGQTALLLFSTVEGNFSAAIDFGPGIGLGGLLVGSAAGVVSLSVAYALSGAWIRARILVRDILDYLLLYLAAVAASVSLGWTGGLFIDSDLWFIAAGVVPIFAALLLLDLLPETMRLFRSLRPWLLTVVIANIPLFGFWGRNLVFSWAHLVLLSFWIAMTAYPLVLLIKTAGKRDSTREFKFVFARALGWRLLVASFLLGLSAYTGEPGLMALAVVAAVLTVRRPFREIWRREGIEPAPPPRLSWRAYLRALWSTIPIPAIGPILHIVISAAVFIQIDAMSLASSDAVKTYLAGAAVIAALCAFALWRFRERARAPRLEIAIYWMVAGFFATMFFALFFDLIDRKFIVDKDVQNGLLIGALAVLGIGITRIVRSWKTPESGEIAVYWAACSVAGLLVVLVVVDSAKFSWPAPFNDEMLTASFLATLAAAVAAGLMAIARRKTLTVLELGIYWLGSGTALSTMLAIFFSDIDLSLPLPGGYQIEPEFYGLLLGALLSLALGLVLAISRRRSTGHAEWFIYWLGFNSIFSVCLVAVFATPRSDLLIILFITVVFVLALATARYNLRRHRPAGGETAAYWLVTCSVGTVVTALISAELGINSFELSGPELGMIAGLVAAIAAAGVLLRGRIRIMRGAEFTTYAVGCAAALVTVSSFYDAGSFAFMFVSVVVGLVGVLHWWLFVHRRLPLAHPAMETGEIERERPRHDRSAQFPQSKSGAHAPPEAEPDQSSTMPASV